MRKLFYVLSFMAILLVGVSEISAQKSQRIALKWSKGEAGRAVAGKAKGTISEDQFIDFKFRINESRGVDIGLYPMPEDALTSFDIIGPNGKVLFKNIGDFLDDLNDPGVYTVRVYLVKETELKPQPGKVAVSVTVFMYVP